MNEGGRLIYNLSEVCKAFNKAACLVTTDFEKAFRISE